MSIKKLDLSGCSLNDAMVGEIVSVLQGHPMLRSLFLSENEIHTGGPRQAFAGLLSNSKSRLKELDVSAQRLSDGVSMAGFIHSLKNHRSLQTLNLSRNGIADISDLIEIIASSNTLQDIDLSYNALDDASIASLATKIASMKNLKRLVLENNKFSTESSQLLRKLSPPELQLIL